MRLRSVVLICLTGLSAVAAASASELNGNWTVDLSAEPDKPYTKPMVLNLNTDGSVQGSFMKAKLRVVDGRWIAGGRVSVSALLMGMDLTTVQPA